MSNQIYSNASKKYLQTARYYLAADQSIPNSANTIVRLTESFNNISGLSYDGSTGIFTINEEMSLIVTYQVRYAAAINGTRSAVIGWTIDGSHDLAQQQVVNNGAGDYVILSGEALLDMAYARSLYVAPPTTFILNTFQNSTAALNILATFTNLSIARVA